MTDETFHGARRSVDHGVSRGPREASGSILTERFTASAWPTSAEVRPEIWTSTSPNFWTDGKCGGSCGLCGD